MMDWMQNGSNSKGKDLEQERKARDIKVRNTHKHLHGNLSKKFEASRAHVCKTR